MLSNSYDQNQYQGRNAAIKIINFVPFHVINNNKRIRTKTLLNAATKKLKDLNESCLKKSYEQKTWLVTLLNNKTEFAIETNFKSELKRKIELAA